MHFDEQARRVLAPVLPRFWLSAVKRHWRGKLPLPFSFWGAGAFVYLIAHFLARLATYLLAQTINPIAIFLVLVGTYGLMFVGSLWWWAGTWRANKQYRAVSDGKNPWSPLVTIAICLSILGMVYMLWGFALPQIDDAISDITEDSAGGPRGVKLVGQDEIEVFGPITRSVTSRLEAALASPAIATIMLTSLGGRAGPAFEMAHMIQGKSLRTVVQKECDSACTVLFMAGAQRCIYRYARLGFHSFAYADEAAAVANRIYREQLQNAGVSAEFIDRVLSMPPDGIFYPDFDQLRAAKVVTCVNPLD